MAAKNVDIKINTTASGTGAKQTEDGLKKVGEEAEKTSKKRISAEERAALKAEQAAKKAADAVIREEKRKTVEAEKESARRVKAAERAVAQEQQALAKAMSGRSQKAGQVGLQVQDIAVQAQMGTAATTILAQQGSQILGAFGPQGAILGGILAIGAAAYGVFNKMAVDAAVAGEAMEDVGETIKQAFSQNTTKEIDNFNNSLKSQSEFAETLRQAELSLYMARNLRAEVDSRLIGLQLKLDEAAVDYLSSTGQIVDKEKALLAVRTQAAEAEKKASIEAELARVENARKKYNLFVAQTDDVLAEQAKAEKRLAELEARQSQLTSDVSFRRGQDQAAISAGAQKADYVNPQTTLIEEQLNDVTKQIQDVNNTLRKIPERINEISQSSITVATEVDLAIAESKSKIDEINQKFDLTTKAQALSTATESITKGAAEIVKEIDEFQAVTPLQQQAKDEIRQAAIDGVINAKDQVTISGNLRTLMSSLKTGQEGSLESLRELVTLNDTIAVKMQQMSNQIKGLKEKISNIPTK
jgi:hypothetical protein